MSIKHIMYTAIKKNVRSYSSSTDRRSQQPSESSEKSLTANRTCDCVTVSSGLIVLFAFFANSEF